MVLFLLDNILLHCERDFFSSHFLLYYVSSSISINIFSCFQWNDNYFILLSPSMYCYTCMFVYVCLTFNLNCHHSSLLWFITMIVVSARWHQSYVSVSNKYIDAGNTAVAFSVFSWVLWVSYHGVFTRPFS